MVAMIDFAFFDEIHAEHGDVVLFRLPETIPELPKKLHGAVMTAQRMKRLAEHSAKLLALAAHDFEAAENEATMSRNRRLSLKERLHHQKRQFVLREQGDRRQVQAYAEMIAVSDAVLVT